MTLCHLLSPSLTLCCPLLHSVSFFCFLPASVPLLSAHINYCLLFVIFCHSQSSSAIFCTTFCHLLSHFLSALFSLCHFLSFTVSFCYLLPLYVTFYHLLSPSVILSHLLSSSVIFCHLLSSSVISVIHAPAFLYPLRASSLH